MKRLIYTFFMLLLATFCFLYREDVIKMLGKIRSYFIYNDISITNNSYYREYDFIYVQNTKDFKPKNKQELINIFYSIINSGQDSFAFYCPNEYVDCISDVKELATSQEILSHIKNLPAQLQHMREPLKHKHPTR